MPGWRTPGAPGYVSQMQPPRVLGQKGVTVFLLQMQPLGVTVFVLQMPPPGVPGWCTPGVKVLALQMQPPGVPGLRPRECRACAPRGSGRPGRLELQKASRPLPPQGRWWRLELQQMLRLCKTDGDAGAELTARANGPSW